VKDIVNTFTEELTRSHLVQTAFVEIFY